MDRPTVLPAERAAVETFDWGELTWYASGALGNSNEMTVGKCVLRPGRANPSHTHANCEEVLHVLSGRIRHAVAGRGDVEMGPGDTISIPPNTAHNAANVGIVDAVLMVAFSSPDRQTRGEGTQ